MALFQADGLGGLPVVACGSFCGVALALAAFHFERVAFDRGSFSG